MEVPCKYIVTLYYSPANKVFWTPPLFGSGDATSPSKGMQPEGCLFEKEKFLNQKGHWPIVSVDVQLPDGHKRSRK